MAESATIFNVELSVKIEVTANRVGIEECRKILGSTAETMTDAEIEALRDDLERTAEMLFDEMAEQGQDGLSAARWDTHFRLTGEAE